MLCQVAERCDSADFRQCSHLGRFGLQILCLFHGQSAGWFGTPPLLLSFETVARHINERSVAGLPRVDQCSPNAYWKSQEENRFRVLEVTKFAVSPNLFTVLDIASSESGGVGKYSICCFAAPVLPPNFLP